jgi:hypothetical protein
VRARFAFFVVAASLIAAPVQGQSTDSDGDGLSDFQEIHKYGTDPHKLSTAGDGVPDGDWDRRREFAYSIRSVIRVMEPVNVDCLNDDYQDARVVARRDNHVELEVIYYPLNTMAEAVTADPQWRQHTQAFAEYLRPGITTNWDENMRRDLVAALRKDGIEADRLDDRELVTRVSRWLMNQTPSTNMFCTHYMTYKDGKPIIYPGLEAKFASDQGDPSWTIEQQLERELFGRSMFANRSRGTCTSSAVYITTVLRALGIPARMLMAIPLVDANDADQVAMVRDNLHHHRVKQTVLSGLSGVRGYSNHTLIEVLVGGRWVRLNYTKLGQNILDSHMFGLVTHVNTFNDLSDIPLAATWGKRYALGERDEVFRFSNPYRADQVSDHFGKYARIDNSEVASQPAEHEALTLTRAYWAGSPESPEIVKRSKMAKSMDPTAGYVLVHVDEWNAGGPATQYRSFTQDAGKEFLFRAEGHADVRGRFWGTLVDAPEVHEIAIVIAPQEYAKMDADVDYEVLPQNKDGGKPWKMRGRIVVRKSSN